MPVPVEVLHHPDEALPYPRCARRNKLHAHSAITPAGPEHTAEVGFHLFGVYNSSCSLLPSTDAELCYRYQVVLNITFNTAL